MCVCFVIVSSEFISCLFSGKMWEKHKDILGFVYEIDLTGGIV